MNVIAFPTRTFSHLDAGRDGSYVLFSYGDVPVEAHGPFSTVAEAGDWAAQYSVRERVRVDWASFGDIA